MADFNLTVTRTWHGKTVALIEGTTHGIEMTIKVTGWRREHTISEATKAWTVFAADAARRQQGRSE